MKRIIILIIFSIVSKVHAQQFDSIPLPSNTSPICIRTGPDSSIYVAGYNRLDIYKNNQWTSYTSANGYRINEPIDIVFNQLDIWIAGNSGISLGNYKLQRLSNGIFTNYDSTNTPIPYSKGIYDLHFYNNKLWVATNNGFYSFDGFNWTFFDSTSTGFPIVNTYNILENSFGLYVQDQFYKIRVLHNGNWIDVEDSKPNQQKLNFNDYHNQISIFKPAGFIHDSVITYLELVIDPCVFKDEVVHDYYFIAQSDSTGLLFHNDDLRTPYYNLVNAETVDLTNYEITDPFMRFKFLYFTNRNRYTSDLNAGVIYTCEPRYINSFSFKSLLNFHQNPLDCPYLDINQVRARIWNDGVMFWDLTSSALYEVPKFSGKTSIFANGFWIGGLDQQNNLHVAAQTYRQSGSDYWPGPLDTLNASIDSATLTTYNKLWKIDRSTVDDFLWHFNNGDVQNGSYIIPDIILNWPANGSGNNSRSLAPFHDQNNDGIYNPYEGDFPKFKGSQLIWNIFNDNYSSHGETGGTPLGLEIHQSSYAFNCPAATGPDSVLNYTTLYHYDIYNRSDTDYHNVFIGIYTDTDLGYYLDDYVGCDSINDYGFSYNGDNVDEGRGYDENPPMINQLILKGPLAEPGDGIDNNHNGIIDEPEEFNMMSQFRYWNNDFTAIGNPTLTTHYYQWLTGFWKDNTPIVYGGNGYNANGIPTNYMFTGIPYSGMGWTEQTPIPFTLPNEPADRRMFTTSGPFSLPAHSGPKSIDIAYVYTRDPNNPNGLTTSIVVNQQQVMRIKQMFESNTFPCDNVISVPKIDELLFSLYPNPSKGTINLTFKQKGQKVISVKNVLGQNCIAPKITIEDKLSLDLNSLNAAMYFITVTQNGVSATHRVVIN